MRKQKSKSRNAVSLFSNCGAGDVGYKLAGFNFEIMAELDTNRLEVCILNHSGAHPIPGDLNITWKNVVTYYKRNIVGDLDLLSACPPCQGFSSARGKRGMADNPDHGIKDKRNLLSLIVDQVSEELNPKLIVVENVPAYLARLVRDPVTHDPISMANLLISRLSSSYNVFPVLVDLCEYGIPQTRKRVFFTFVRKDLKILQELINKKVVPFPSPTHIMGGDPKPITLGEAFKAYSLPKLDARSATTSFAEKDYPLHIVPVWDARRYEMVSAIPANSGLSAWENSVCLQCGQKEVPEDKATCPSCGQPMSSRPIIKAKNGKYRLIKGFKSSSYRRMNPNSPAPTITTATGHVGSHSTIHPIENRVLSPLECAYLQTFPVDFCWGDALKKCGHTNIRQMIGEAVPPRFTEMHGKILNDLLNGVIPDNLMSVSDRRYIEAKMKLGIK